MTSPSYPVCWDNMPVKIHKMSHIPAETPQDKPLSNPSAIQAWVQDQHVLNCPHCFSWRGCFYPHWSNVGGKNTKPNRTSVYYPEFKPVVRKYPFFDSKLENPQAMPLVVAQKGCNFVLEGFCCFTAQFLDYLVSWFEEEHRALWFLLQLTLRKC